MNVTRPRSGSRPRPRPREPMTAPRPQTTFEGNLRQAPAALRAGRAATAERSLRALEAQSPGQPNCRWLLGVALLEQDKIPESIATLAELIIRVPDFAQARVDLARAYRSGGFAARAREEVRRGLEENPHHPLAMVSYGGCVLGLDPHADTC